MSVKLVRPSAVAGHLLGRPEQRTRRIIPMRKAKSPMRLVMNALRPAQAFSVSWYQKPIRR
jgi:hypothetical protein